MADKLHINQIEKKWQKKWESEEVFEPEPDKREKFFIIFAYPGMSGYLHVGHMRSYTYPDIIARYKRMRGYNVLFPAGYHASGLPAIGFAKKVQKGGKKWINYLKSNGCPEKEIKKLKDPKYVVKFFKKVYRDYWKDFGFSIDFRREMTTIDPSYKNFIKWQFRQLKKKNLLVQKPHFAPYCRECGPVSVDASETDLSEGGTAEVLDFVLIKFKCGEYRLPAATLRPETVFGVTNIFLNPDEEYYVIEAEGEKWIVSKKAKEKLSEQKKIRVIKKAGKLVGKDCINPITSKKIPILAGDFVDPDTGTGVVMSVPAHAPYDWVAIDKRKIKPISIIDAEDYGPVPAKEECKKLGIKKLDQTKLLEKATENVYKKEFHTGIMKKNCGKYAGEKVLEAKEDLIQENIENKKFSRMKEFSEKVVCRCGKRIFIKTIPDQWFIKYSDEELTKKSQEWTKSMQISPEQYKNSLPKILEWFKDRACVRQGDWLGTEFPFDEKWTVEPIADSTLYPGFYIVSKYINQKKIKPNELDDSFFNYVFLGRGKPKKKIFKKIRKDFEYWYPLDMNCGGKEHKTVHFPVFIMNHAGIMPKKHWPKGIFVNWWVTGKKGKISKSKGGAKPIPDAAEKYGVDAMRLYYCHVGSPHTDIVWDSKTVNEYKSHVSSIYGLLERVLSIKGKKQKVIDKWLESSFNKKLGKFIKNMNKYRIRQATNTILFGFINDLKHYIARKGSNKKITRKILEKWLLAINPIVPHVSEEFWRKMGKKTFSSLQLLPDPEEWDEKYIFSEKLVSNVKEDINNILKIVGKEPKKIKIFVAPKWKRQVVEIGNIKKIMKMDRFKKHKKQIPRILKKKPEIVLKQGFEAQILNQAKEYFESIFDSEVDIIQAEKSHEKKSEKALPGKPAILVVPE